MALFQMTLWDSAAESKMELMMCQHVTVLNVSGFPFAQFESENVLSLMVTNNETQHTLIPNFGRTHYSAYKMTAGRPDL